MNSLITAGILYTLAGSLRFIRRKLYPGKPNPSFDKTFGTLLLMGLILLGAGVFSWFFPNPYAQILLLVILIGGTTYLISSLDVFSKLNTEKQTDNH